ncbi:allantoinase AllB [Halalkalibacter alkalisediminis]|uniref:Allantoinase AllB n=1 Tax=Halalkalibacter alkalisediminis TaxID=935616 RepID=A0ABV6NDX8_9BACI|nr:allantoinase AllB [Halalkalibacter alkalisediminis]
MKQLLIRDGMIFTSDGFKKGSIVINDGLIEEIVQQVKINEHHFSKVIDATDSWILPGFIDAHVHFNDPGREEWEGFKTGSRAAAAGGITTVIDMPLNSSPSAVTAQLLLNKQIHLQVRSVIDYGLWAGITSDNVEHFDELKKMNDQGIVGFKAFLSNSGIEDFPAIKKNQLQQAMGTVKKLNSILALHAEDQDLTEERTKKLKVNRHDRLAFLESRPQQAEYVAIEHALGLAEKTGAAVHFVHVSCPEAIELINHYKQKGVDVTVEICPHYLLFTDEDFIKVGPILKCAPPLRSVNTVEELWECIAKGWVDTIGSDHSPCPLDMKTVGNDDIWKAWGGIQGVQFAFPFLLSAALERGFSIEEILPLMTSNVAKRFHLQSKQGKIEVGQQADLTLYQPTNKNKVNKSDILTKNDYSPYEQLEANGKIQATLVRGELVYERNSEFDPSLYGLGIKLN